jgi:hypothetical protein
MKYYRIDVIANSKEKPSFFIGSALRGAFGYALEEVACKDASCECIKRLSKDRCLYYRLYKSDEMKPFRIDTDLPARTYDFSLYFFSKDENVSDIETLLAALKVMMLKKGIGKGCQKISSTGCIKFPKSTYSIDTIDPEVNALNINLSSTIKIHMKTPCILINPNKERIRDIGIEEILSSIYKRKSFFVGGQEYATLPFKPKYKLASKQINAEVKVSRESLEQNKKIVIEGTTGVIEVRDLDKKSYELLKLGEILGVGSQAVRGLGKITIESNF